MDKIKIFKKAVKEKLSFIDGLQVKYDGIEVIISYKERVTGTPMLPSCVISTVSLLCDALGITYYIDGTTRFRCYTSKNVQL
jgi:hypothetical protein